MERKVEYCQWVESYSESKSQDSNGNEQVTRTYFYTLGWRSSPLLSLTYDQPAAHHNPLRAPFPAQAFSIKSARVGGYKLDSDLIGRMSVSTASHVTPDMWSDTAHSPAATEHNFRYVGNGYFYSKYEPSGWELLLRGAAMTAEGTLLDYQLGDLFRTCQAGDIRVWYEVARPTQLSVLAGQSSGAGHLSTFTTSRGYEFGLVQGGLRSAEEMIAAQKSTHRWQVVGVRVLTLVWGLMAVFGFDLVTFFGTGLRLATSVALAGAVSGAVNLLVFGWNTWSLLWYAPLLVIGTMAAPHSAASSSKAAAAS